MTTFWIVIADAGRALVMSKRSPGGESTVVHQLENPTGRLHISELVSDQGGRIEKSGGPARSAMEPKANPHEQEASNFAHQLGKLVDDAADQHKFDRMVLIAPPHFMGLLHANLSRVAGKRVVMSEKKDLMHLHRSELEQHINELIRLPSMAVID